MTDIKTKDYEGPERRQVHEVGYDGPERRKQDAIHPWRWRLLLIWIIVFTIIVFISLRSQREQGNEIQQQRVASCRLTYEGVRDVFKPFFPPPKYATPEQISNHVKFNRIINYLKHNCNRQVHHTLPTTSTSP